ncbi:formate/nitrite transporter family protein [Thermohalobaculum xanthum]|nr:formate/nitrite transporter family protein [Thermohalobaculum xanthum]
MPDDHTRPAPAHPVAPTDAHPPQMIARLVEEVGVRKATLGLVPMVMLGLLAGAFIAFGGMLATLVLTDPVAGFGLTRWLAGIAFSLGLVLVVVAGAELFTGNNLIVMAWADGKVTTRQLLRAWAIVWAANFAGALAMAIAVWISGVYAAGDGAVADTAIRIAEAKTALGPLAALTRGILCNALVCLAVWLAMASHTVADRILAVIFPVAAFVAMGFEHSIANMYLIPAGWLHGAAVSLAGFIGNIFWVTLGNMIGGGIFVAGVYWVVYLRHAERG